MRMVYDKGTIEVSTQTTLRELLQVASLPSVVLDTPIMAKVFFDGHFMKMTVENLVDAQEILGPSFDPIMKTLQTSMAMGLVINSHVGEEKEETKETVVPSEEKVE